MPARRMRHIAPFHVMDVIRRCRELESEGRSIIHMEVGEPDFATAEPIVEAGRRALAEGRTGYTESKGIRPLREAIAGYYRSRYRLDIDPQRIIVTPGASGALQLATQVLLDPGSEVLLADPSYPCNRHFVRLADAVPTPIPVGPDSNYQPGVAQVEDCWGEHTAALMLASPSNPTGTVLTDAELAAVIAAAEDRDGRIIMDEIYHGLEYAPPRNVASSALRFSDKVFVINSFSKYFGMTGWRLGWLVAPPDYVREVEKLSQNVFISAPTVAQYAALAAFQPDTLAVCERRREAFRERRDFLLPALRRLGFEIALEPAGAFYLYADCARLTAPGEDSYGFAFRALEQAGVAFTPGLDFGSFAAGRHVRFAYTNSIENLAEGVERLRRFLVA